MIPYLNISIALIVFMGLVTGGMLSLVLMTTRRYLVGFSIILGLAALLAVAGVFSAVSFVPSLAEALANAVVLLILSFALGYTLTTFSVLSFARRRPGPLTRGNLGHTAVVLLAAGEPPYYGVESASRRLSLADDAQDVPPVLLRPFYLRDLRRKYAAIGRSPYREYYIELSRKVQSRLDSNHKVYMAFYNDNPTLPQVLAQAIGEGARHITLVHTRTTDPADAVKAGELLEGMDPESYGVSMSEIGPLFQSDLLPQIYVRRVLEAVPLVSSDLSKIGVLLVGRGHALSANRNTASVVRYNQENDFQERLRNALLKVGFGDEQVVVSWLRWSPPTPAEGLGKLAAAGCKVVLWMPSTFAADGTVTLYDIPSELDPAAKEAGISLVPLGAWNADDLAAEAVAAMVRATSSRLPGTTEAQSLR